MILIKKRFFLKFIVKRVEKKSVSKDIKSAELFYFKEIFNDIITLKF